MEPWATEDDLAATACAADASAMGPELDAATAILFALTGGVWPGPQVDVIRPCSPLRGSGTSSPAAGYPVYGTWTSVAPSGYWCGCTGPAVCNCNTPGIVVLPGAPAVSVDQVLLDGFVLDPGLYRLMDQMLVRVDGRNWPCCQDWTVPGDQPGAFEVTYTWGADPPPPAPHLTAVLACELHRSAQGAAGCRLPQRVTTATRQGLTMTLLDPLTMFPEGQTGIPEIDLWLGSLRYGAAHRPATIMVPGQRARRLRDA